MKVLLVNLDRDADRLAAANAQLVRLGVAYARLPAVYAKALPSEEKRRAVDRFRWWCVIGRPVRDGEIGCAMSHFRAWETGCPVCVLEDDVILDARFPEVLRQVGAWIDPERPQVVLLSNHSDRTPDGNGFEGYRSAPDCPFEVRRSSGDMFTEGYVITPKAAEAIRRANWPLATPCDHWGRWARLGLIELYHAFPTVCSQNKAGFASGTVTSDLVRVADLPFHRWLCHKAKRALGLALDRAALAFTGRMRIG